MASTHEYLLCEVLYWHHWAVKLLGYSVLTFVSDGAGQPRQRRLVLPTWHHASRWYPILHNVILQIFVIYYIVYSEDLAQYSPSNGSREYVILTLCVTVSAYTSALYKILENTRA